MRIKAIVAVAAASAMLAGGVLAAGAPVASADASKGVNLHGCPEAKVRVAKAETIDGEKVAKGTYRVAVRGISCDRAESLLEDWVATGDVDHGFAAEDSEPGELVLGDDHGTDAAGDDAEIRMMKVGCGIFVTCPSGSTVTVVNMSGSATAVYGPAIAAGNSQGVGPTPVTLNYGASQMWSRYASGGGSDDLSINVTAPLVHVFLTASSHDLGPTFCVRNHGYPLRTGTKDPAPHYRKAADPTPGQCFELGSVNTGRTVDFPGVKVRVDRSGDDFSQGSPNSGLRKGRYQYKVTVYAS